MRRGSAGLRLGQHARVGANKVGAEDDLQAVHLQLAQHVGQQPAGVAGGLRLDGEAGPAEMHQASTRPTRTATGRHRRKRSH